MPKNELKSEVIDQGGLTSLVSFSVSGQYSFQRDRIRYLNGPQSRQYNFKKYNRKTGMVLFLM